MKAYIDCNMTDDELCFWRTRGGYEADFIIEHKAAIGIKTSKNITSKKLRELRASRKENAVNDYIIVCQELF